MLHTKPDVEHQQPFHDDSARQYCRLAMALRFSAAESRRLVLQMESMNGDESQDKDQEQRVAKRGDRLAIGSACDYGTRSHASLRIARPADKSTLEYRSPPSFGR